MTGRELLEKLSNLSSDELDLPVMTCEPISDATYDTEDISVQLYNGKPYCLLVE